MYQYKRLSLGKDENGKRILKDEHRYLVEQFIGRKLSRNEVVHHIDGNKKNNDISNLKVMSLSEHTKIHSIERTISEETKLKISNSLKGKKSPMRNKSEQDIINIAKKYKEFQNYRKVDRFFNYANGTTGEIIRGEKYKEYQNLIKQILET